MQKLVTVIGPTAVGKSDFAVRLAKKFNGEIISADSRQIYKNLNLTTGKITEEETQGVKHHLIDILDVGEPYSVYNFVKDAKECVTNISSHGKLPIVCGGTGLYTRALVEGFDLTEREKPNETRASELGLMSLEELSKIISEKNIPLVETDAKNKRRVINAILKFESGVQKTVNKSEYDYLQICLTCERKKLRERIKTRLQKRIDAGMIDEIKNVLADGADKEFLKTLGLDVKNTVLYLEGEFKNYEEYFEKTWIGDCQFAKRQVTWFKKEKNCVYLDVLDESSFNKACEEVEKFLETF